MEATCKSGAKVADCATMGQKKGPKRAESGVGTNIFGGNGRIFADFFAEIKFIVTFATQSQRLMPL